MPNVRDDDEESLEFADESEYVEEDDWDEDEYCEHDCGNEGCYDDDDDRCRHQHCWNCGACRCPGYCDDYQTYNLRPAETGGTPSDDLGE